MVQDSLVKLAINYSPQAAALLEQGKIEFDLYKCAPWPEMIAAARAQRPVYVHFPLLAGRGNIEKLGCERISDLLEETETRYVNTHLAPRAGDFDGVTVDTRDSAAAERLIEAMQADIAALVNRFGADRVILENACWDPDPEWQIPRIVLEPEVIARVVCESECSFLLDVAHVRLNAMRLEMDERDYLARLPVECLRELHITGVLYDDDKQRYCDHFPMTSKDWALAEWVLGRIRRGEWPRPWVVTLEYGGTGPGFAWRSKEEVLAEDAPRMAALVRWAAG